MSEKHFPSICSPLPRSWWPFLVRVHTNSVFQEQSLCLLLPPLDRHGKHIFPQGQFWALTHSETYLPLFLCCPVTKSCLILCDTIDCSMPGFLICHHLLEFAQVHAHLLVTPSNHLILCGPLLLLPSIFPSIRVFSNELALHIRWPKYWSFSFSISPLNEHSGLISFRIDWFDLLSVQGTLLVHTAFDGLAVLLFLCRDNLYLQR